MSTVGESRARVWRFGPVTSKIHRRVEQMLELVEACPDLYLKNGFLADTGIRLDTWHLIDTDKYFRCMTESEFASAGESSTAYNNVKPPGSSPPTAWIANHENCAELIGLWFHKLQRLKFSKNGSGARWLQNHWFLRELEEHEEELYSGYRGDLDHSVPYEVFRALEYKSERPVPHQIFYHTHADSEAKEGVVLRTELKMILCTMLLRMSKAEHCMHIAPVRKPFLGYISVYQMLKVTDPHLIHPQQQSPHHDRQL